MRTSISPTLVVQCRKNLDGQCRRRPDPLYGQGVFCIGHASEAYQLGLLNWADVQHPARPAEVAS